MKFSVIIPTCHRDDLLALCLERLAPGQQSLEAEHYEVIVTDDGIKYTAEKMIRERFPWVRWVVGPKRGPASNRNHGAKEARGEWLVFTDDDCLPLPEWLQSYACNLTIDGVLEGLTKAEREQRSFAEESPINLAGGYLWSCNFAVKKEIFEWLGGFDEKFPAAAMEDCDLRERLRENHIPIHFVQEAALIHPWRQCKPIKFRDEQLKSLLYFYEKHPKFLPNSLPMHFFMHGSRILYKKIVKQAFLFRCRGLVYAIKDCVWHFKKAICLSDSSRRRVKGGG